MIHLERAIIIFTDIYKILRVAILDQQPRIKDQRHLIFTQISIRRKIMHLLLPRLGGLECLPKDYLICYKIAEAIEKQ